MILSEKIISSIIRLIESAGKEIMRVYSLDDFRTRLKEDLTPVTMADLVSDRIIKSGLEKITPGVPVFSEETKDVPWSFRSGWNTLWILDPLDGTREFIAKNDEFCISLVLVKDKCPAAGFIHAPVSGETWFAIKGQGAFRIKAGKKTKLPLTISSGPLKINISRTHHTDNEAAWIENFRKKTGSEIVVQGSAIKFCKIAEGESDIYPKFSRIHEWDIAAGHIILEESGGKIIEHATGKAPLYNKEDYYQQPFIAFGSRVKESDIL